MKNKAFTLIELVLVISLIGFLFAFSLPKFRVYKNKNSSTGLESWLKIKTKELKAKANSSNSLYSMNFDVDSNSIWIGKEKKINDEEEEQTKEGIFQLPEHIRITGVTLSHEGSFFSDYKVYFYKNGYSDKAIIYIENDKTGEQKTFIIEPFLSNIIMHNESIY